MRLNPGLLQVRLDDTSCLSVFSQKNAGKRRGALPEEGTDLAGVFAEKD